MTNPQDKPPSLGGDPLDDLDWITEVPAEPGVYVFEARGPQSKGCRRVFDLIVFDGDLKTLGGLPRIVTRWCRVPTRSEVEELAELRALKERIHAAAARVLDREPPGD